MYTDESFEDIRPYRDHEFRPVMDNMLSSPLADQLIATVFPQVPINQIKSKLKSISTIKDFQEQIIYRAMLSVLKNTSKGLSISGTEHLDRGRHYLFMSNHRDIILDPSIINTVVFEQGFETAEVAIGDNLLQTPWVKDLARLNKSFIVKRNLSVRELIQASKRLSDYIRYTTLQKHSSVWIAQREGRAKDGNDRTQQGVLNMLGLAAPEGLKQYCMDLNILPVSLSYELDPCDSDKVRSLYALKHFGGYTKKENEDNLAMRKGILGNKGHIHIHFGKPITGEIAKLPDDMHKNDLIVQIAKIIDHQIITNYKLQTSNYIAYDQINGMEDGLGQHYSEEEKLSFLGEIDSKIQSMDGDPAELRSIFLEIYARPYENKLNVQDDAV